MKRIVALLASLLPLSLISAQSPVPSRPDMAAEQAEAALFYQRSLEVNEIAGKPQSLEDSHRLIDLVADIFAKDLPPSWLTRSLRDQIAQAEYETTNSAPALIPEQRVVEAWNRYVKTIGASPDAFITVAEFHNFRDGSYASARYMWSRGIRQIWSVPTIYATTPDEKLADGCTAVEVLRVLSDISNQFGNLRGARERVKAGVLVSDTLKPLPPGAKAPRGYITAGAEKRNDPIGDATRHYAHDHGTRALNRALQSLTNDLFPQQT